MHSRRRAFISGRYGRAIPLIAKEPKQPGISIASVDITDSHAGSRLLDGATARQCRRRRSPDRHDHGVIIRAPIPDSFLSGGISVIKVAWPFLGSRWTSTSRRIDPKSNYEIVSVQLTRDLTAQPGNIDITVVDRDGKTTRKRLVIEPCALCKSKQG